MHAELRAKGLRVGKKRVARVMRESGLAARRKRRFRRTTDSNHDSPIAPNVLERSFDQEAPNKAWVTDVTYIFTSEGWLYLAVMLDLFSRRVVGWATSDTNDRRLALDALDQALRARRPRAGLVHHSDRGSAYASEDYRDALRARGITVSMSRTGDYWDSEAVYRIGSGSGGPSTITLGERSFRKPDRGEALLRVHAAAVNPASRRHGNPASATAYTWQRPPST